MFNVKKTKATTSYSKKTNISPIPKTLTTEMIKNLSSTNIEEKYKCINSIFKKQNEPGYFLLIGYLFQTGLGLPRNGINANYWYQRALRNNETEAPHFISYIKNLITNKDNTASSVLLQADTMMFYGNYQLAYDLYYNVYENQLNEIGGSKSSVQLEAAGRLGSLKLHDRNPEQAKEGYNLLVQAANGGDPFSMVELGHFFKARYEYNKALKWYSKASGIIDYDNDIQNKLAPEIRMSELSKGIHPDAPRFAGEICEINGTLPELEKALKFYKIANLIYSKNIQESIERVENKIAKIKNELGIEQPSRTESNQSNINQKSISFQQSNKHQQPANESQDNSITLQEVQSKDPLGHSIQPRTIPLDTSSSNSFGSKDGFTSYDSSAIIASHSKHRPGARKVITRTKVHRRKTTTTSSLTINKNHQQITKSTQNINPNKKDKTESRKENSGHPTPKEIAEGILHTRFERKPVLEQFKS